MASEPRRSRRLRGLIPEEPLLQQVCFICQRNIDIDSLTRCKRTACCHVLMHRTCHREMVRRVRTCGNCRRPNAEFTGIVLETDEEMIEVEDEGDVEGNFGLDRLRRELNDYREDRRDMYTHSPGSYLWTLFPYEFEPFLQSPLLTAVWYFYYAMLEDFATLFRDRPMYVHGRVLIPVPVTAEIREVIYRLFIFNTPFHMYDLIRIQRFRLLFVHDAERTTAKIEELTVLPYPGGPSFYQEDNLQWT